MLYQLSYSATCLNMKRWWGSNPQPSVCYVLPFGSRSFFSCDVVILSESRYSFLKTDRRSDVPEFYGALTFELRRDTLLGNSAGGTRTQFQLLCRQPPGHQVPASVKCPRQELNLIYELRGLACESGTLQGQISSQYLARESNPV